MNSTLDLEKLFDIQLLPSKGQRQLFESLLFKGWVWNKKSELYVALCLEKVNLTSIWLQQAGLLLAANAAAFDGGIFIDGRCAWLGHRIPVNLSNKEIANLFEVQVAVAQVLTDMS